MHASLASYSGTAQIELHLRAAIRLFQRDVHRTPRSPPGIGIPAAALGARAATPTARNPANNPRDRYRQTKPDSSGGAADTAPAQSAAADFFPGPIAPEVVIRRALLRSFSVW